MFTLNLKLFLLFLVAGGVSSLKCYQVDASKCNRDANRAEFFKCLKDHTGSVDCPPSSHLCRHVLIIGGYIPNNARNKVVLKGCDSLGSCDDLQKNMLGDTIAREEKLIDPLCEDCAFDDCGKYISMKDFKGSKNSTAAPSAAPKKKNGGSRSCHRITKTQQMSIVVLILLFSYF